MSLIALSAESTTLVLNGVAVNDFVEGDYVEVAFANPATSHTNSANGGVNINKRVDAGVADLTVRVQRYSESDVYLNGLNNQELPVVIFGSIQESLQRDGAAFVEAWTLESGSITTQPNSTKNNQEVNGVSEYVIRFRSAIRTI